MYTTLGEFEFEFGDQSHCWDSQPITLLKAFISTVWIRNFSRHSKNDQSLFVLRYEGKEALERWQVFSIKKKWIPSPALHFVLRLEYGGERKKSA